MSWCNAWLCVLAASLLATSTPAQEPAAKGGGGSWKQEADGSVTVQGKVVFVDRQGDRHERASGRATATLWFKARGRSLNEGAKAECEIKDGAFCVSLAKVSEPPEFMTLSECSIADVAVLVETQRIAPSDKQFVLQLRGVHDIRLRVFDAGTKLELDGVEVFKSRQWGMQASSHPGPERDLARVVEARRSPCVVLAADHFDSESTARLWVRAPGHAWTLVDALWTESGMRDVPLAHGGSLRATLGGELPGPGVQVALRCYQAKATSPVIDCAVVRGKVDQIDGLVAGDYEVRLEHGEWHRDPQVLARAKATVEPGRTAEVELKVTGAVVVPGKSKVRGTLVMPVEWNAGVRDLRIQVDPLHGSDRRAQRHTLQGSELAPGDKAGEYRFAFSSVFPGRYVLAVSPGNHAEVVTVPEHGSVDLRIEVSPPIEVVLRLVDAGTKEPRKGLSLRWDGAFPETLQAAADANEIRFRAAAGHVWVSATGSEEFYVAPTALLVARDAKEFEVAVQRVYGVTVALYEGSTKLPMTGDSGWTFELKALTGGRATAWSRSDGTETVLKPGTYVLSAKGPDGWQPVADQQVKVTVAPFPVLAIKVARK